MGLKVGIQLYSVRKMMAIDPIATIEKVVGLGYKYIEVANHNALQDFGVGFGVNAGEINRIMKNSGAQVVGAHIYPFEESVFDHVMEYHLAIGNRNIVYPMEHFNGEDDTLRKCELMNRLGKKSSDNGLVFLYHNHSQEFQTIHGRLIEDIIVENTDPRYVSLELDTFWSLRAGMDSQSPVNVYSVVPREQTEGEIAYRQVVDNGDFTEIGTGIMDIQRIINTANEIGAAEYIILEQDFTRLDELESIRVSMEAFKRFNGIQWD
jgi:sugar phosphate isomerase/epimerase